MTSDDPTEHDHPPGRVLVVLFVSLLLVTGALLWALSVLGWIK